MANRVIICGSGLAGSALFRRGKRRDVRTEFGTAEFVEIGGAALVQRHGAGSFRPPHEIDYKALIAGAADLGAREIFSFCSVGSLDPAVPPGLIVLPDDVFCPWRRDSFFGARGVGFSVPRISSEAADTLAAVLEARGLEFRRGGTYCQTLGPSFETKAEIRFLRTIGKVVGMTAAQEVFLACELDIPIALLCSCDNYAHGIVQKPLLIEEVEATAARNREKMEAAIGDLIETTD